MNKIILTLALTLELAFLFAIQCFAGDISYVMTYATGPYTKWTSAETQPSKGNTYTDSNAHTTSLRLTNYSSDTSGMFGMHTEYDWNPESSDGKYIALEGFGTLSAGGDYYLYTTTTSPATLIKHINDYITTDSGGSQQPELRWDSSGNHPTWLYYRANSQFRYLDVSDMSDHLRWDASTKIGSGKFIWSGDEGSSSEDSRYWVWMIAANGSGSSNAQGIITYDNVNNQMVSSMTMTTMDLNNVYVSKSGTYITTSVSKGSGTGRWAGTWSCKFSDLTALYQLFDDSKHMCPAYDYQGNDVLVYTGSHNSNGGGDTSNTDTVQFTRMDNGYTYPLYYYGDLDSTWSEWNDQWHAPGLAKKGIAFVGSCNDTQTSWSTNQLFGFQLDENHTSSTATSNWVWRLASAENICNGTYYYNQTNISINTAGTKVYWGSDWRNSTGHSDTYVVQMPTNWYTDLFGGGGGSTSHTYAKELWSKN